MTEYEKLSHECAEAAREAAEQARALAGRGALSDREFLEGMARSDRLIDHPDDCGCCAMQVIMAQVARDLLAEGEVLDGVRKWSVEARRRWEETDYFKLYREEEAAGRDPHKAFEGRGWEA
jgi:hypothetical protein